MKLVDFENLFVEAFRKLDSSLFDVLDESIFISHDYKDEFIQRMNKLFDEFKSEGLTFMLHRPAKCKYCYPESNACEFLGQYFDVLVKFVIYESEPNHFHVEECKNKPPITKDGLPF